MQKLTSSPQPSYHTYRHILTLMQFLNSDTLTYVLPEVHHLQIKCKQTTNRNRSKVNKLYRWYPVLTEMKGYRYRVDYRSTELSTVHLRAQRPMKGSLAPRLHSFWTGVWPSFTFTFTPGLMRKVLITYSRAVVVVFRRLSLASLPDGPKLVWSTVYQ